MNDIVRPELRSLLGDPRNVDRRTFVVTSLGAGFAAAVLPVSAQTITTPADGLIAGEVKVPDEGWRHGRLPCDAGDGRPLPDDPRGLRRSSACTSTSRTSCRRFAKLGYFAIAPELFARQGDAGKATDVQALIRDIVAKVPDAQVMADLDATVAYAKAERQGGHLEARHHRLLLGRAHRR